MSLAKAIKSFSSVKRSLSSLSHSAKHAKVRSYEDAIVALNSLQPNSAEINKSIRLQQKHSDANFNLRDTEKYLERIDGFTMKSLEKFSVIHVAGSKGKGSVCTYTDAILREHNVVTGLFTSPHLVSVTERIKIRGNSISRQMFTNYFFEVFDALQRKKEDEHDLPSYFKFLQIMAFYIFARENVDVAIVEVGIGGEYDSTNILRHTEIAAITALHLEHTQLLGESIDQIAWQKAGIIKESSDVFTFEQPEICMKIIRERYAEKNAKSLSVTPPFDDYIWAGSSPPDFSSTSEVNKLNFSMALQISARWLRNRGKLSQNSFHDRLLRTVDENFIKAFQKCQFEGRFQKISDDNLHFYLDGAHTTESMKICLEWYKNQIDESNSIKVLVFNVTGDRDSSRLLEILHSMKFRHVYFTTNIAKINSENVKCENYNGALKNAQVNRCFLHRDIWQSINVCNNQESQINVCATITEALEMIDKIKDNNDGAEIDVLFTGSIHLIGSTLSLLTDTELNDMTKLKIKKKN